MKRHLIIAGLLILGGCKPEVFLGPLDSPLGNWKGEVSKYYFNGENVYEAPGCTYSAISFYKDSLCCIEGEKGVFRWSYSDGNLVVDSTIWYVMRLSGADMVLDYAGRVSKEVSEAYTESSTETPAPDAPESVEYHGMSIETEDGVSYWYINSGGKKVECWPKRSTTEDSTEVIACWWDTRSDTYKPF